MGNTSPELIPEPSEGDREKLSDLINYVAQKCNTHRLDYDKWEIGCLEQSHLWIYRKCVNSNTGWRVFSADVFLLQDPDPTSAAVLTKTSVNGRESFSVTFKITNNRPRHMYWSPLVFRVGDCPIELPCRDGQDAERVGKATAALILAYGAKGEVIGQ